MPLTYGFGEFRNIEKHLNYCLRMHTSCRRSARGVGIVFLEALACGVPVIGCKVDGSREALLDGQPGCLVDPNVPEELVWQLLRVCRRLQLLRGRSHASKQDHEQIFTRGPSPCSSDGSGSRGNEHPSRWAAVTSIAAKIGCTPQTLHDWVKKAEVDRGQRAGIPTEMADKLKALERENRELRQANEILRKASWLFRSTAQLDRRYKP